MTEEVVPDTVTSDVMPPDTTLTPDAEPDSEGRDAETDEATPSEEVGTDPEDASSEVDTSISDAETGADATEDTAGSVDALADSGADAAATSLEEFFPPIVGTGASGSLAIGPAGGVLTVGTTTLTVPPDALTEETLISMTEVAAPSPAGLFALSPVYEFEPAGLTFARPASLSITIGGPEVAQDAAEVLWTVPGGDISTLETTTFIRSGGQAIAEISHFSSGVVQANLRTYCLPATVPPGFPPIRGTENVRSYQQCCPARPFPAERCSRGFANACGVGVPLERLTAVINPFFGVPEDLIAREVCMCAGLYNEAAQMRSCGPFQ
jgi:hypothetical protein